MRKAYRYRFYPTDTQKEHLAQFFGSCRFVYNFFLALKKQQWEEEKSNLSYLESSKTLTSLKQTYPWLDDVSSVCLQQTLRHLYKAFGSFFKKQTRFPKFKKRGHKQACTFMKNAFTFQSRELTLAKLGPLNIRWSRYFQGSPSSLTLTKDSAGRYFVSFIVEEMQSPLPFVKKEIGIDLGIAHMLTDQAGKQIAFPGYLHKALKRLRSRQQRLSSKVLGSQNREKAKYRIAKLHAKIQDRRLDFLHKTSRQLINENQVIAAESLGVKTMLRDKKLARKIGDAGWGMFLRMLSYKSQWYHRTFVQINKYFPSSKRCSCCGEINKELKLQQRHWCCSSCMHEHHRDTNAARNILQEGLRLLAKVPRGSRELKPVELV